MQNNRRMAQIVGMGCAWLDQQAAALGAGDFASLHTPIQIPGLQWATRARRSRGALWTLRDHRGAAMNDTQVALIGSGPGGAAIAWSLASAGVKVTILEAGPRYQPREDYRLHLPDWEQQHFPEKISSRAAT
jgi:hypothetical protein